MVNPTKSVELKFGAIILTDHPLTYIPLKHTQVNAHLTGLIASVVVSQRFENPTVQMVELNYLFPLPHLAALVDFKIVIGSRIIQADLREREQAQKAYQQALDNGQQAALIDQLRPNLISLKIANVRPGEEIQTNLQYEERLQLQPDGIEFVFPMGLTPRYHSPQHPVEPNPVNPAYGQNGSDFGKVDIQVTADPGYHSAAPLSPSHTIEVESQSGHILQIRLAGQNIPDHDFVLRFPHPSQPVALKAWSGQDKAGEVILANWLPGRPEENEESAAPREFVFVLDRSGSMSGKPIGQARNALRACLRILEPQDTFRILLFDHEIEWYQPEALPVMQSSIQNADIYLNQVEGRGGTEIIPALEAALNLPAIPDRVRYILFLTDGAVSAEEQAVSALRKGLKQARIFTFGIGPSVNRALLSKMAELGRGSAEFLQLDEDIEGAILKFQDKVAFPMLTDIQLEWKYCQAWDIYPTQMPDLYAGQSLQLCARLKRTDPEKKAALLVKGKVGTQPYLHEMPLPEPDLEFPEAARLWARSRVDDLLEGDTSSHSSRQEIIDLAIEHRLLTPYTAFIALDSEIVNPSGQIIPLPVLQPLPKGLDWDVLLPSPMLPPAMPRAVSPSAVPIRLSKRLMDAPGLEAAQTSGSELPAFLSSRSVQKASEPSGLPFSAIQSGVTQEFTESTGPNFEPVEATLRWLARSQNLDGSWAQGVEFTAAALLAFVRNGQTILRGYYRKQVKRAAVWLERTPPTGDDGFALVFALTQLGQVDQDDYWSRRARELANNLPAPATQFQHSVMKRILSPDEVPQPVADTITLETLRLAAVLGAVHPADPSLVNSDPHGLLHIWYCAIPTEK